MYIVNPGYGGMTPGGAAFAAVYAIIMLAVMLIGLASGILVVVSLWEIFKKAGREGWAAIVPIYNVIVLLEICELPLWYIALFFIPFANIYAVFKTYIELANKFNKSAIFGVLTVFFPYVCLPILAFSKSSKEKILSAEMDDYDDADIDIYPSGSNYQNEAAAVSGYQSEEAVAPASGENNTNMGADNISSVNKEKGEQKTKKEPMNPKTKKGVIIGSAIGGGVLLLIIFIVTIITASSRVDYSASYRVAQELQSVISTVYWNFDCDDVVDYVDSDYISDSTYEGYISGCKETLADLSKLVDELGNSDAVKREKDISENFAEFKKHYDKLAESDEELDEKLDAYSAWHGFSVAVDDLSYTKSSDAEITSAANKLIESGNKILADYGEGWLEKTLAVAKVAREYYNASYSDRNKSSYYTKYQEALTAVKNYSSSNKPDIESDFPLGVDETTKIYKSYDTLYESIRLKYQEHYRN
ncbi:MAG: DUF5684 domain-containing protein [Candidatus Saccharibacteria bacterium]|nr:DUF5684 domain-containing protein [Candidatus Saccharibacteria bacterium]